MQTREIGVNELRVNMVIVENPNADKPRKVTVRRLSKCTHGGKGAGKVHVNETQKRRGETNYGSCYDLIGKVTILVTTES